MDAADRAARFVLSSMRDADGTLLRSYRIDRAHTPAFLEDYAFLLAGLLALHRSPLAAGDGHLAAAVDLADAALAAFAEDSGDALVLHDTRAGQDDLFVRSRSTHDGAVPSGSGVFVGALLDLATQAGDDPWLARAVAALRGVSAAIADNPLGSVNLTRHLLRFMLAGKRVGALMDFDAAPVADAAGSGGPVAVLADEERVRVGPNAPASFTLALEIADPYHIVAANPGPAGEGLIPLRVGLVSGSGVAVYADYPDGSPYGVAGFGTINVHTGRVEFTVALEHAPGVGATPGEPVLGVTFQACTDDACLAPATVRLDVAIDLAD
ncbi:MAG: hypothetical protein DHS20C14_19380 [Phycisphaeraceae bacterium]|nr:MAG: hypothetical protein DHS20C14_19380 [Phycisphaeraceae bacterium]